MSTEASTLLNDPTAGEVKFALSLIQPWASLWAAGLKKVETRSWNTPFRGTLLIHASSKWDKDLDELCRQRSFRIALEQLGFLGLDGQWLKPLPRSAIIGCAAITGVDRTERIKRTLSQQEQMFGDYSPGRFAWQSIYQRTFIEPIRTRGALKLWEPEPAVLERCLVEMGRCSGKEGCSAGVVETGR